MVDRYEALARLSKLKTDGVLTDDEFAAEKARVLAAARDDRARLEAAPPAASKWPWKRALMVGAAISGIVAISQYDWVSSSVSVPQGTTSERVVRCDSEVARTALINAFEHSAAERLANIKVLDVGGIVERTYDGNKPERICAADVTLNTGREHTGFRIYPTSDGSNFIVETKDDVGPSPPAAAPPAPTPTSVPNPDDVGQWAQAARDTIEQGDSTATDRLVAAAKNRPSFPDGQLPIINPDISPVYTTEAAARAANPPGTCIVEGATDNGEGWFAEPDFCNGDE